VKEFKALGDMFLMKAKHSGSVDLKYLGADPTIITIEHRPTINKFGLEED
jgi:hypothetical protein